MMLTVDVQLMLLPVIPVVKSTLPLVNLFVKQCSSIIWQFKRFSKLFNVFLRKKYVLFINKYKNCLLGSIFQAK